MRSRADVPPRVKVNRRTDHVCLPWLAPSAGADREWDPPTLDEQVILLSPSGQFANGVVITGLPSDHIPANDDRAGLVSKGEIDIAGLINHQGRATYSAAASSIQLKTSGFAFSSISGTY